MPTSGTTGRTVISTDKILEHAVRRCGKPPSSQTAETISIALDNLYLLLLALSNDGLHLWLIQHHFVSLETFKATYQLPVGSIDLLNVVYSTPTILVGSNTQDANSFTTEFEQSSSVQRIGVSFSAIASAETITFEQSTDGVAWSVFSTQTKDDWSTDTLYWFQLDPRVSDLFFRVNCVNPITVTHFHLVSQVYDIPIYPWNRDDYIAQSNKDITGKPSTNYYWEKLVNPQLTLWPVPNNSLDHLEVTVQRQIQDIGSLTQEIDVPERWKEYIIWQLAKRLAYELPEVSPERVQMIQSEILIQEKLLNIGETDGTNISILPAIGCYTR